MPSLPSALLLLVHAVALALAASEGQGGAVLGATAGNPQYDAGDGQGNCRSNPDDNSCHCTNEDNGSPLCTGNHCVKLSGATLETFMTKTGQNFPDGKGGKAKNW